MPSTSWAFAGALPGAPPKRAGYEVIGLMFDEVALGPFADISIEAAQEEAWKHDVLVEMVLTGVDREYEAATLRKWADGLRMPS